MDELEFCPSIVCGGEGGGGSSSECFFFFFAFCDGDGVAYADAWIMGTKLCGVVKIGGSSFH